MEDEGNQSPPQLVQSDREAVRMLLSRIREHRIDRNWSQAELARRAGISRQSYQNFESGYGNITLANLVRILGILSFTDRLAHLVPPVEPKRTLKSLNRPPRQRARAKSAKKE